MTGLELWVVFTLGLVSSLHCVQMCGPIVLSYSVALSPAQSDLELASPRSLLIAGTLPTTLGAFSPTLRWAPSPALAGQTVGWSGGWPA